MLVDAWGNFRKLARRLLARIRWERCVWIGEMHSMGYIVLHCDSGSRSITASVQVLRQLYVLKMVISQPCGCGQLNTPKDTCPNSMLDIPHVRFHL